MPDLANILLIVASLLSCANPFAHYRVRLPFVIFLSVLISIIILIYCHVTNDFLIENVYYNSHTTKPLLYKISGIWGNKEGSMLLWTLILTLYLFLMDILIDNNNVLKKVAMTSQSLVCLCFLLFTLLHSNPFVKMPYSVVDGLGFNPILQDIGLAIHPPILYLGYLGFSSAFSLSIAALVKRVDGNIWAKIVRPWMLISWSLLTLGISLGSWWAYREMGWGGFWFWDPVENVSLMPWLITVALIHLLLVVKNFNILKNFAVLLTLTTFILSVTGTFLVRSGILSSVHTFADDSVHGFYLLVLLCILTCAALLIFIFYAEKSSTKLVFPIFSRFTLILVNNLLFITAFFIIFTGTVYPVVLKYLTGELISVGTPYYDILFNPIVLIILVCTIIGQYCRWKGNSLLPIFNEYRFSFCSAIAILPFILHMKLMVILSLVSSIGLLIFILEAYSKRVKLFNSSLSESIKLMQKVSKAYYAMMTAHAGVALLVLGITCAIGWQEEKEAYLKVGDSITINKFKLTLQDVELVKEKNFHAVKATISIQSLLNSKILGNVVPEYRFYLVEGQRNVESSIYHNLFSDIYVIVGEFNKNAIATKIYYKPAMAIIWVGSALIAFGSLLAAL